MNYIKVLYVSYLVQDHDRIYRTYRQVDWPDIEKATNIMKKYLTNTYPLVY